MRGYKILAINSSSFSIPTIGDHLSGAKWRGIITSQKLASTDSNGVSSTQTYSEPVTDFIYRVDLTFVVYPHGCISSTDRNLSVLELCDKYSDDSNLPKSLAMKKVVDFDFAGMRNMVYCYIRQLKWRESLSITFPMDNTKVRFYRENCLSQAWENPCICCLCHATIIPCILMRLYRGYCPCQEHHAETHIRSTFRINYTALQVFEAIRPQLGLHSGCAALERVFKGRPPSTCTVHVLVISTT